MHSITSTGSAPALPDSFQCLYPTASPDFQASLAKKAMHKTLEKGQTVFLAGEEAHSFYFIKSGWIKLYRETLDGTQSIIDILSTGHTVGEDAIFEKNIHPLSAEAIEKTQIILFPLSELKNEIENNPEFTIELLKHLISARRKQYKEIEHLRLQSAPQRIGCFLLQLVNQDQKKAILHLPYDKTLIAARLGMQPETFSRALQKLQDNTGITIKGATVTINNVEALHHFSCLTCTSSFPCQDL